jgi:hypothetical protein
MTGQYETFIKAINWDLETQAEAREAGSLIIYCDPSGTKTVKPIGSSNKWQDETTGDEWTDIHHGGRADKDICIVDGVMSSGMALRGRVKAAAGTKGSGDFNVVAMCPPAFKHGDATIQGMADELQAGYQLGAFFVATLSWTLMHEIFHVTNPDSE